MPRRRHAPRPRLCLVSVRTTEHAQRQREIARASRDRSDDGQIHRVAGRSVPRTGLESGGAYQFERRLVGVRAAEMRGDAKRAAEIAADRERAQACRHRGGAAARRSASRASEVPRIVRRPVDRVVALPVAEHHRNVGLADRDRACRFQTIDRDGRPGTHRAFERRQSPRVRRSTIRERFLDGDGDAVQRTDVGAVCERLVGLARARARFVAELPDDRVQRRIRAIDLPQRELRELGGRNLFRAHGRRQPNGAVEERSGLPGRVGPRQ